MTPPEVSITPAPAGLSQAARALCESFAQRHVPLPPDLAEALARLLGARQPLLDPLWGRAFTLMARALDLSGAVAGQALLRGGLDRFALVVAEPLLRAGAARTGVMPLVAAGTLRLGGEASASAAARLTAFVQSALADVAVMGAPFWVHAGLDLHLAALRTAGQRLAGRRGADLPGPECDPALGALVFLEPPEFDAQRLAGQLRRKARPQKALRRAGLRPKEGGVTGIRPSRSFEDLPDALFSELVLPKPLFMTRLVQEGMLVRHRPPRRDPRRDLLSVTLHRAGSGDGMGLLVKAAWADAAIRLRVALAQAGLGNSDLVWSQDGCAPALLDCAPDLPGTALLPPLAIAGRVRADMLMRSGLFPGFAEWPGAEPEALPDLPAPAEEAPPDGELSGGTFGADPQRQPASPAEPEAGQPPGRHPLRRMLEAGLAPLAGRRRRDLRLLASDYGRQFALISGPASGRRSPDWGALRAGHAARLGPWLGRRCRYAALLWSAGEDGRPLLTGLADGHAPLLLALPGAPVPEGAEPAATLNAFMGQLVLWMMDVTLEALDGRPV